jgi:endo-alpha-1,4-polygalactosaminidase (GH114 family)
VHNIDNYKKNIIIIKENTICLFNSKQCTEYQNKHKNEEKLINDKINKLREDKIKKETTITKETFKKGPFTINYELKKY